MQGKILSYDPSRKSGVISGSDGVRYSFVRDQWHLSVEPSERLSVDFNAHEKVAVEIYADPHAASTSGSKRIVAALLAFFLGVFGVHKFYLGYKAQGFVMSLVFILGWILLGIPSFIIGVIAFIEAIVYIIKSDEEFERAYVAGRKGWF